MAALIFTYLLTAAGVIGSLINPYYGLLVYISFAIIRPAQLWQGIVPLGNYSRIVAIAFLVSWLARGAGNWKMGRAKPIFWAILGYWGWVLLSAYHAPNQDLAWLYIESNSKTLLPVLVGFTLITSSKKLKQLAWVIVLSQGFVALLAHIDAYFLGSSRIQYGSAFGTTGDNNYAAVGMLTVAGVAFFLGLHETIRWRKYSALAVAALTVHSVILSYSRGGMLGLVVVAIVTFVLICRQPKYYLAFTIAALVGIKLVGPYYVERFMTVFVDPEERDNSARGRIELWKNAWDAMQRHPVVGLGPGHFGIAAATQYGWGKEKAVHSTWMSTGSELGFPGLGFLLAFYGCTLWKAGRLLRGRIPTDPWFLNVARMTIASLAGFLVSASFITGEGIEQPYFVALLGAGALKLAARRSWSAASAASAEVEDQFSTETFACS